MKIEAMELDLNIETVMFESKGRIESQIQDRIKRIFDSESERSIQDAVNEYLDTNDLYKRSVDIPTPQALVDMGCNDNGYLELTYLAAREYKGSCCRVYSVDPDTEELVHSQVPNNGAGRMNHCHFSEMCKGHNGRLYRLEMKTGRELPKHKDIQWLSANLGCTIQEADLFNKAFSDLEIGQREIYKLIFGYHNGQYKTNGIQKTGNKHLQTFLDLQESMKDLMLTNDLQSKDVVVETEDLETENNLIQDVNQQILDKIENTDIQIDQLIDQIGCTIDEARQFKDVFISLKMGIKEIYRVISSIKSTGNVHLQTFLDLKEWNESEHDHNTSSSIFSVNENNEDIDEVFIREMQDEDLINLHFKENLSVDSNIFTFKRLSIPEESLTEEEIAEIKYADFEQYKRILKKYMEPKFIHAGKDEFGNNRWNTSSKKITSQKIPSAVSMAWSYLKDKKDQFAKEKAELIKKVRLTINQDLKEALEAYESDPSAHNRHHVTTSVHGGVWEGRKLQPATKEEKMVAWSIIY